MNSQNMISALPRNRNKSAEKPVTKKSKSSYCNLCENKKKLCHNVLLGSYCRDAFKRYCTEEGTKRVDVLSAKKVFLNAYNNYREIKEYEFTKFLNFPKRQRVLPKCVVDDAFEWSLEWLNKEKNE